MAENTHSWTEIVTAFINYPEKSALFMVLIVGAWRWIRELWHESKDDANHESLLDMLLKENRELRDELRKERQEQKHHD